MDKRLTDPIPTLQFQMPHFVLGGPHALPGLYSQPSSSSSQGWSEYDKNWYGETPADDQNPASSLVQEGGGSGNGRANVTPRPFEFDSPHQAQTPPSLGISGILANHDHDASSSCRVGNDPANALVLSNPVPSFARPLPPTISTTPSFSLPAPGLPDPTVSLPPLPPSGFPLYSASGFDMLRILAKVATRPNPKVMLGPVDMTCSFVVVDVRRQDSPIVYASPTFTRLTGYTEAQVLGRNCRFLQSPSGNLQRGDPRHYTSPEAVRHLHKSLLQDKECQACLINYRKDGSAFINLVTIIPISAPEDERDGEFGEITHSVGFQVDLSEQPNAILQKLRDGSYIVNYSSASNLHSSGSLIGLGYPGTVNFPGVTGGGSGSGGSSGGGLVRERRGKGISTELLELLRKARLCSPETLSSQLGGDVNISKGTRDADKAELHALLLANTDDFIHVVSLKGSLLYVAPAITRVLGHDPADLMGKSIVDFCHPADVVPLMRELKDASSPPVAPPHPLHPSSSGHPMYHRYFLHPSSPSSPHAHAHPLHYPTSPTHHHPPVVNSAVAANPVPSSSTHPSLFMLPHTPPTPPPPKPVNLLFRALHKSGAYVWLEARGRLHVEQGKGRKAVVLVGRRVDVESVQAVFRGLYNSGRGWGHTCGHAHGCQGSEELEKVDMTPAGEPALLLSVAAASRCCCSCRSNSYRSGMECWGLVAPNGLILSANPMGAYRLGLISAAGSGGAVGGASSQIPDSGGLVGRSLGSLVVGPGPSEEEGRRVGEVLAGAACADREEVRKVRCLMKCVGVSGQESDEVAEASGNDGRERANDGGSGSGSVPVEIRFYSRERRQGWGRKGRRKATRSNAVDGRGEEILTDVDMEGAEFDHGMELDQVQDQEEQAITEDERRRAPSLPPSLVFQILFLEAEGTREECQCQSPPPLRSHLHSYAHSHSHSHSHSDHGAAPLSSPSIIPSSSSPTSHISSGTSAFPTSSCTSLSTSAATFPSASSPTPTTPAPSFPSTSPSAETSWQYELTRLRFENKRMREEVGRLEMERAEHERAATSTSILGMARTMGTTGIPPSTAGVSRMNGMAATRRGEVHVPVPVRGADAGEMLNLREGEGLGGDIPEGYSMPPMFGRGRETATLPSLSSSSSSSVLRPPAARHPSLSVLCPPPLPSLSSLRPPMLSQPILSLPPPQPSLPPPPSSSQSYFPPNMLQKKRTREGEVKLLPSASTLPLPHIL